MKARYISAYNNYVSISQGLRLLIEFFDKKKQDSVCPNLAYHIGRKSIFENKDKDTRYCGGTLIELNGLSPRLLMFS